MNKVRGQVYENVDKLLVYCCDNIFTAKTNFHTPLGHLVNYQIICKGVLIFFIFQVYTDGVV